MQGVYCGQCRKKAKKEDQQAQVQKETQGQSPQEEIRLFRLWEMC
jgi:hypothetical protein